MDYIPYGHQSIDKHDIQAVLDVLDSEWLTQGPMVKRLEESIAAYCKVKYAVCVSSGTAALHLASLAAGLQKGDEAITTPITFLATSNAILYTGAKTVFADIDYETVNINPKEIRKRITKETKVILPVHFAGLPCDMEEIYAIAKENNIKVIEDACHALGAQYKYNGRWIKVGSCKHSDMTVFSFHPIKTITTGEGGAITTNSREYYERLLRLRNHGISRDKNIFREGSWHYQMRDLGYNYRITDIQCALGISQLKKIELFIKKRKRIAAIYASYFSKFNELIKLPQNGGETKKHAWHLFILRLRLRNLTKDRRYIFEKLRETGIGVQVHYIPIYRQLYYRKMKIGLSACPYADKYYQECISIPIYVCLEDRKVKKVVDAIKDCILPYKKANIKI